MKGDLNDGLTYREALAIGTKADGATKCTFATIYADPDGKQPLFSLQRDKTNYNWLYKNKNRLGFDLDPETGEWIAYDATASAWWLGYGIYFDNDHDETWDGTLKGNLYEIDIPIVRVDEIADTKCVPATLLPEAIDLIKKSIQHLNRKTYYIVYAVAKPGTPGYPNTIIAHEGFSPKKFEDNNNVHYEHTTELRVSPKYQKLLEVLDNSEKIYIKPDAFVWEPLDARNATITIADENGQEISVLLDDYITDKKAAFEKARKMLILAGGAALL